MGYNYTALRQEPPVTPRWMSAGQRAQWSERQERWRAAAYAVRDLTAQMWRHFVRLANLYADVRELNDASAFALHFHMIDLLAVPAGDIDTLKNTPHAIPEALERVRPVTIKYMENTGVSPAKAEKFMDTLATAAKNATQVRGHLRSTADGVEKAVTRFFGDGTLLYTADALLRDFQAHYQAPLDKARQAQWFPEGLDFPAWAGQETDVAPTATGGSQTPQPRKRDPVRFSSSLTG